MRKFITCTLLLSILVAHARTVSREEAAAIAAEVLTSAKVEQTLPSKPAQAPALNASDSVVPQPFYVFNNSGGEGFVIISGDTRARKVLGYSDKGTFDYDNLPPQLSALLDDYAAQITAIPDTASVDTSWTSAAPALTAAADTDGVLLETANWGQGHPYNLLCPEIDGNPAPTGCVATAMAIVMKYHQWPDKALGTNVYWDRVKNDYETTDYSKFEFDWEVIKDEVSLDTPDPSTESIASLMYAAGRSVDMAYCDSESGAMACYIGHALRTNFKYAESCEYIHKDKYTDTEWTDMLRRELDAGHPVIYQGSGNGNHAFVCDGYSNDGFYHFNWGWDGNLNGYFTLSALTPGGYNFSQDYSMIRGIVPDKTGREYSDAYVDAGYTHKAYTNGKGITTNVNSIKKGEPFSIACRYLTLPAGFSGEYGVAITDSNGKVKSLLTSTRYTCRMDCREEREIEFLNLYSDIDLESEDLIQIVAKRITDDIWLPVRGTSEAPTRLNTKQCNIEKAHVELISKVENTFFNYFGQGILPGQYEMAVGAKLGFAFALEDDELFNGDKFYNCIVTHNGRHKVLGFKWPTNGSKWVIQKGEYTVTLVGKTAQKEEIVLSSAGNLQSSIIPEDAFAVTDLTISGSINYSDLEYIRDVFIHLQRLDLSNTSIVSYQSDGNEYPEHTLPSNSLCGLESMEYIYLPKNIKSIGTDALSSCNLQAIDLPSSITSIEDFAFSNNPELNSVMVHWSTPIQISPTAFASTLCPEAGTLYVPLGSKNTYATYGYWAQFGTIEEKEIFDIETINYTANGVKYKLSPDGNYASIIGYTSPLPSHIDLPEKIIYGIKEFTLTSIREGAFAQCYTLVSLSMPNTITEIGKEAFWDCINLKNIILSNQLKYIPWGCFSACSSLEEIDIPESVLYIDYCSFESTKSLRKIHLSANVELNPQTSFSRLSSCESLTVDELNPYYTAEDNMLYSKDKRTLILIAGAKKGKLIIPDHVEMLPCMMCCGMPYITDIQLPAGYSSNVPYQFIVNCPMIKHITLPDASKNTSTETVSDCKNLESLTIGRSFEYITGIHHNPKLKHVFLRNESQLNLGVAFNYGEYMTMNFYTDRLEPNAILDKCNAFYVPGGCKEKFENIANCQVSEMWQYLIDRKANKIAIIPTLESAKIDKVCINGNEVQLTPENVYSIENADNLDVRVEFTLMDRQPMTTHYDAAFNASLADTDLYNVTSIALSDYELDLIVGQSKTLIAQVLPEYCINKDVVWSSDNQDVATVDSYGIVSAVAPGTATITVKSAADSDIFITCRVTVKSILAESLSISPSSITGVQGDTFRITAEVKPEDTTDKSLTWSSDNPEIATVDAEGLVSIQSEGTCWILVSTVDGSNLTAECIVTGLSGIDCIFDEDTRQVDVYSINGVLLKRGCDKASVDVLAPGVYIVKGAKKTVTLIIPSARK